MCEQITLYAIIHFEKEKYKEDMSLNQENKATGRPSEERKWMQYYPEMMLNLDTEAAVYRMGISGK